MANVDNPNGFKPWSADPRVNRYTAGAAFSKGDLLMVSSGKAVIHDAGKALALGVAATSASGADVDCLVYDDANTIFIGQTSGSYGVAENGTLCDVEGTTGIQELNENGHTALTLMILRQELVPGSSELGNNARVLFTISQHVHGGTSTVTP